MKKFSCFLFRFVLVFFLLFSSVVSFSQNSNFALALAQLELFNEVELGLAIDDFQSISSASDFDVDRITSDSVFIYCNQRSFVILQNTGLEFKTIPRLDFFENVKFSSFQNYISSGFNVYPTYNQYDSIMQYFANSYPNICNYSVLGVLPSGRKIVALNISKNVGALQTKPSVLYTATIHGNETAGYIFMLKFIQYLLEGYGVDAEATQLVDSLDIWINPLSNPDGTYFGGNHTVSQAIRYNSNAVDLNRNYPDPLKGSHPDNNQYQAETMIFMGLADTMDFSISANFHGGAEVVNYPWDTWSTLHADDSWWYKISRRYADSCHVACVNNGYLNDLSNGVTNGYQWYLLHGGRQDFMNYFHHCRELTLELSSVKLLPENQLDIYWNYNKRSLIDYLKNAYYGLKGVVSDSTTGLPLKALVEVLNHDVDSSQVWSSVKNGFYHRMLDSGYYSFRFSSPGYYSQIIDSVFVTLDSSMALDIQLVPVPDYIEPLIPDYSLTVFPNPAKDFISVVLPTNISNKPIVQLLNANGILLKEFRANEFDALLTISVHDLPAGVYFLKLFDSCVAKPNYQKISIIR